MPGNQSINFIPIEKFNNKYKDYPQTILSLGSSEETFHHSCFFCYFYLFSFDLFFLFFWKLCHMKFHSCNGLINYLGRINSKTAISVYTPDCKLVDNGLITKFCKAGTHCSSFVYTFSNCPPPGPSMTSKNPGKWF